MESNPLNILQLAVGMHRDGLVLPNKLQPLDAEVRRRLWCEFNLVFPYKHALFSSLSRDFIHFGSVMPFTLYALIIFIQLQWLGQISVLSLAPPVHDP
jgi:hypothetical protein